MYFKKAVEIFDHTDLSFEFKWVGHFDKNHEEVNTGCKSLDAAFKFLKGNYPNTKCVCLYDCDTNKSEESYNNIHIKCMPPYENKSKIKKGIENALILDSLDLKQFYKPKHEIGDYGEEKDNPQFQKMECCKFICSLRKEELKKIMLHLNEQIIELKKLFVAKLF